MSNLPPSKSASLPPESDTAIVRTQDMMVGRKLRFPIRDRQGTLLLAEGATITPRFKQLLVERQMHEVVAAKVDAAELTHQDGDDLSTCLEGLSWVGPTEELATRLDSLMSEGGLFVKNKGPAVKQNVVYLGCKAYDPKRRAQMEQQHQKTAGALDSLMQSAIRGGATDGKALAQITGAYLSALTTDCDMLMQIAAATSADQQLSQHCLQMAMIGMAIAVEMGLDADNVQTVGMCGMVHDWGMLRVPEHIRNCKRMLTRAEFTEIQKHPIYSLEMLSNINGLSGTVPLVCYQVHERPDGSGYPRGRSGRLIHPFAKILHVADAYVALTSPRPYRAALMPHAAIECLLAMSAEGSVDHDVVQKLLMTLSLYPIGSLTELSDNSIAQTMRRNGTHYSAPHIRVIRDGRGRKVEQNETQPYIDLMESKLRVQRAVPFPGRVELPLTDEILCPPRR